ncbi:SIR2 family protein [Nocardioides sp.]|uniref:SIR2 family NAD-dependent protein deacylase n=1 Tax=Nocardioides sp. TaxID=35761 RepID=UPI00272315A5|nr:SIR2 family protein [Nocardioides sp.]MDO9456596.1 SIR2 family protein [Nocardioides sp.]
MSGHLFVAQGDLTRLACDAVVVPCDGRGNVTGAWSGLLPDDLPLGDLPGWRRIGAPGRSGVVDVGELDGRRVLALDTHSRRPSPTTLADRTWDAIDQAGTGLPARDGRAVPLVALPLVGTGAGGLRHRRGEVVTALLERCRARSLSVDAALVLRDRRDVAAVQQRRTGDDWLGLPPALLEEADRLGRLAGAGRLSLFLGAGVSVPVGLPDWTTLLRQVAAEAPAVDVTGLTSPLDVASRLVRSRGKTSFLTSVEARVSARRHGIGHALLAGLGVRQSVTTNFDSCFETAVAGVGGDGLDVLTRDVADGSRPWLLKLHGDVAHPPSMMLTREQYDAHRADHQALNGVVQSLLLTGHLLFVGFSLTDDNFLDLARQVDVVRDSRGVPSGTALALTTRDAGRAGYQKLTMVPMSRGTDLAAAGRVLEMFLDRLAWTAAHAHELSSAYLLDDAYASSLPPGDLALKQALLDLAAREDLSASAAWPRVAGLLERFGLDL